MTGRAHPSASVRRSATSRGAALVAGCAAGLLAACGQGSGSEQRSEDSVDLAPQPSWTTSVAPPAPEVPVHEFELTWTSSSGIEIDSVIELSDFVRASSPEAASSWRAIHPNAPSSSACVGSDAATAVAVGSISFSNQTPDYVPERFGFSLFFRDLPAFYSMTGDNDPRLAAVYDEGESCGTAGHDAWVVPDFEGEAEWGPVPIAIVLPNLFSPNEPAGDPTRLAAIPGMTLLSFAGEGRIDWQSGSRREGEGLLTGLSVIHD